MSPAEQALAALQPSDLFPDDRDEAARVYRRLARQLHPDQHSGCREAFEALNRMWDRYNHPVPQDIHGDIANLAPAGDRLHKMTRHPRNNDLIGREITSLGVLADKAAEHAMFFPTMISHGRQKDPATGALRRYLVLERLTGCYDLDQVGEAYLYALHARDVAWIWRRVLTALGAAHRAGIIHGAVLPPHIMVQPEQHALILVDWCYSVQGSGKVPALVSRYRDLYAPEIPAKEEAVPATDIYMAAATMHQLLGTGNGEGSEALRRFARGCMATRPRSRPDDAWALLAELDERLVDIFGPPRFHEFAMPAGHRS